MLCFGLALALSGSACVSGHALSSRPAGTFHDEALSIAWFSPSVPSDEAALSAWRQAVGPPVVEPHAPPVQVRSDEITVVAWNIANGEGDAVRFVRSLPPGRPIVLLLQEALRGGAAVPRRLDPGARFAGRLGVGPADAPDIEDIAATLGLNLYYGRTRQARALRGALGTAVPTVVGGDFNTWFGFAEQSYVEMARAYPDGRVTDRRPTFRGLLRLDHLFFRLGSRWRADFRRADDRFGSDHFPLVGSLRLR